ncbi:hypothetical protein N7462_010393 [Penicillium macrosclerotiorum]|uniref:uncharacterized protein n=1 Tax=Penicillium macrosclerotiorum TaxID=303699 RepID=UPI002548A402|nr:uncharacterized protein N7462_010393 [Penicillium macrosclerotiorum]KAJ5669323.1 hypothetical protein N7462_010393 [Penicillium macrosclerotiorum]
MGGSRRPTLCTILLQATEPELHEYNHALSRIGQYYVDLPAEMRDDTLHEEIVLHPTRTLARLQKSFDILKTKDLTASVAEGIFKSIVLPLINSTDRLFSQTQSVQLIGSVLPLVVNQPIPFLRQVADLLIEHEHVFENLVAEEMYATVIKGWLLSKKTYLDQDLIMKLTERLVSLCDGCSAGHGVGTILQDWRQVMTLISSLENLHAFYKQRKAPAISMENLPPLENMKALSLNDKKSSRAQPLEKNSIEVSTTIQESLNRFKLPKVESLGTLAHALERLRSETVLEFMHTALKSFPCRVCLEMLNGTSITISDSADLIPQPTLLTNPAVDLFGKRVGLWKVLLSDTAMKNIKVLAREGDISRVTVKLKEIASGKWHGSGLDKPAGSKKQRQRMQIPIMRAVVSRSIQILWQIDVGFYDDSPWLEQQIVKVWDIVGSNKEVDHAIDNILGVQDNYQEEIITRCRELPTKQSDGYFLPNRYGLVKKGFSQMKFMAATKEDRALVDMSNKFYNVTEPFLNSIVKATGDEEFPFELSPEEMEIVGHFDTSSMILGRSGTGKTTCLLFKILAKYRARQAAPDEKCIRQLLLTRSPHLASKLQTYTKSLIDTQSDTAKPTKSSRREPLESFFVLSDDDFPFVCTYDEFLSFLEKTFRRADRQDFLGSKYSKRNGGGNDSKQLNGHAVDFNAFKTEYWGSLSSISPSGCSAELLFAEIMGVVKGSGTCAKTLRSLTRSEYLSRSSKSSPAFASETEREKVFTAFERYEKLKKQRNQIDELDRVNALLQTLRDNPALLKKIRCFEEIYVDEIQDLRCLDIALLLNCLRDARGIHLAGDTAQCISKDSAFRFPEIKALFYEYYEIIAQELNQPLIAKPKQFMLAKNYRSHQGILSFASWVMQLLWNGFPETIDKLDPEIGQTGGPRPIIFAGFDSSILSAKMIGLVRLNDQVADFGAEQVILVRDEESKDKLQSQIGEVALVLTILESKGMEFDDVLIYNFFGASGLGSSYRCLHLLAQESRTRFDSQKHAPLCSELKQLYVAVTRARKQLWFMETAETSIDPIHQALAEGGDSELAEIVRQKDENVAEKVKVLRAGGSVDPERWLKRAAHLLHQKNFADALFCYKKADNPRGIAESQARLHEQDGRSCRAAKDVEGFSAYYEKAISLFLEIDLIVEAVGCLQVLGKFDRAAEIWKNQGQLQEAATLYEQGGNYSQASECYHLIGEYEQALDALRRGDQFDEIINYINRNQSRLSSTVQRRYSRLCNILLKQGRISSDLRAVTINLLGSDVEKLSFFKEFEMFDQLRSFYATKGRWFEYYESSLAVGDLPAAMDTLLTHKLMPVVDKKTVESILHYTMAELLLAHRGIIENRPELAKDFLESSRSTPLEKTAMHWLTLFDLVDKIPNEIAAASAKTVSEGLLKDFFCLFVISYEMTDALRRKNVIYLPFDILMHAGRLIQDIEACKDNSMASILLLCGLYSPPKQNSELVILSWSAFKPEPDTEAVELSTEELLCRAKFWIRKKFSEAIALFENHSFAIFRNEFPRRCLSFIIRGRCIKQRQEGCDLLHERPGIDTCQAKLNGILNIAEVYSRLSNLYYQRIMDKSFSVEFLKRRRRWVQMLMDEVSFVSSLEQSPIAISKLLNKLLSDTEYRATRSCFEGLLFHRLTKDWSTIQIFTGLLEQIQLAHLLGPECGLRYTRSLFYTVLSWRSRHLDHPDALKIAFDGIQCASNLRWALFENRPIDFVAGFKAFCSCVQNVKPPSFTYVHSLISIFELASTQILCVVNPANAIAIPMSWALQYLPNLFYGPIPRDSTTAVYSLAQTLETANRGNEFILQGLGRKKMSATVPKRRVFDMLTTIILNLSHHPVQPRGLTDMWDIIGRALEFVSPGFSAPGGLQGLRDTILPTYAAYNGKDKISVILLDDNDKCPPYLRDFVTQVDQSMKLSVILRLSQVDDRQTSLVMSKIVPGVADYSSHDIKTIESLQSRWRRIVRILSDRRRMEESLDGQLFLSLHNICESKFGALPGSAHVSAKEKIRIRKLLYTDGIKILVDLEAAFANFRHMNHQWRQRFDFPFLPVKEIEELDQLKKRMMPIETRLHEIGHLWSLHGLNSVIILMSSKALGEKAREAQRVIWALKKDIEAIQTEVESIG